MNTEKGKENEDWRLEYKCRRCGGIDRTNGTTREQAPVTLVQLTNTTTGWAGGPWREGIHHCPDGGLGMAEIVGAARVWNKPIADSKGSERLDAHRAGEAIHIREVGNSYATFCGVVVVPGVRVAPVAGCDEGATCEACLEKF